MCANESPCGRISSSLVVKHQQLEEENKCLWEEIKSKNQKLATLNEKLVQQEDLLKQRVQMKKLLSSYLDTIRTLQRNFTHLQNENKMVEYKFYASQVTIKQLQSGDHIDHQKVAHENAVLKLKVHALEKQIRRYAYLWNRNIDMGAEMMAARESIASLEQRLLECQPIAADCKQTKSMLFETQSKFKSVNFTNSVLREELDKAKSNLQEISSKHNDLKGQLGKYIDLINKLRDENTSMESFVEKSFRLEGALAELDDLNVVLKKEETMLGILFDENQNLKDGISQLFDEMNVLKDRNWKLEKYATEVEESFYAAEKNVNNLEHRLDYYRRLEVENEKLELNVHEMKDRIKYLKSERDSFVNELKTLYKKLDLNMHDVKTLRDDNHKLINENSTLLETMKRKEVELFKENDSLKSQLEKYSGEVTTLRKMQTRFVQSQDVIVSLRDEIKVLHDENIKLKEELDMIRTTNVTLKSDRDRFQQEYRLMSAKYNQLQDELSRPRYVPHDSYR